MYAKGRAVVFLVIPSIAVIAGVVALASYADTVSRRSEAESTFEAGAQHATDARTDALQRRVLMARAIEEAERFAAAAGKFVGSEDRRLDAAALEALAVALGELDAGLPILPPVAGLPSLAPASDIATLIERATLLESWSTDMRGVAEGLDSALDELDVRLQTAQTAFARVAASAPPAGAGLLADTSMATAEVRAELEASLEALSTRLGAGALPLDELTRYLEAASAARASHDAAVDAAAAAAAAGSSTGGGSARQAGRNLFENVCSVLRCIDLNNPPVGYFYGNYVGSSCPQDYKYMEQYSLEDGELFEVFPDYPGQRYGGRVIPIVHNWALLLEFCD